MLLFLLYLLPFSRYGPKKENVVAKNSTGVQSRFGSSVLSELICGWSK